MNCPGVVHDAYATTPVDCLSHHTDSGPSALLFIGLAVLAILAVSILYARRISR